MTKGNVMYTYTHTYRSICHSATNKEEILPFVTTCEELEDMLSVIFKGCPSNRNFSTGRERKILYGIMHMWNH